MSPSRKNILLLLCLLATIVVASASDIPGVVMRRLDDTSGNNATNPNATATDLPSQYIGYGALQADRVPCDVTGASYYNCRPSGAANPYTRSCSAITNCRN
ncbi:hypothetical protein LUZ63_007906 [Rhynchospora breviuscula]|uniref:Uncharacterized protein n=1 Tax=Rhynchospora breviuscula TaxID=2022672 RepID=A0A9Q0CTS8_9POAL|nr:hypothetical protein LUZ63_007906 [Rhynchospora breviuscula]